MRKSVWVTMGLLATGAVTLTSCGSPQVSNTTPSATTTGPLKTTTPPSTTAAAAPKYGGYYDTLGADPLGFDEGMVVRASASSGLTNNYLIEADWSKGPSGSNRSDYVYGFIGDMSLEQGAMAQSWELPDAQTIIFHVRPSVHYFINPDSPATKLVNGREFTADDAVFNLNRVFFEATKSDKYNNYSKEQKPTSIKALDKYTVEVKVNPAVQGTMLTQCGNGTFMYPPEVIKQFGNINDWRNSCGTGPFMITDYVQGSSLTYVRNPNYWKTDPLHKGNQLPYADGIKELIIPDLSTQIAAFDTGKIDRMTNMALEDYTSIVKVRPNVVSKARIAPPFVIAGRVDKQELPFKDIRVRQALNMATNKQDILANLFQGHGYMLAYPYSNAPCHSAYYTPLAQQPQAVQDLFTYNPDKAKQLLAAAGYPSGFKTQVLCQATTYRGMSMPDFLSIIKAQWSKVGVDLQINPVDSTVYQSQYRGRAFPEMLFTDGKGYGWPYQFNMFKKSIFDDVAQWDDQKTNDYYDQIQTVLFKDPAKMDALLKDFGPYILGQAVMVWLPAADYYTVWQPWLKGYAGEDWLSYSHFDEYMQYVWIDQTLKKSLGY